MEVTAPRVACFNDPSALSLPSLHFANQDRTGCKLLTWQRHCRTTCLVGGIGLSCSIKYTSRTIRGRRRCRFLRPPQRLFTSCGISNQGTFLMTSCFDLLSTGHSKVSSLSWEMVDGTLSIAAYPTDKRRARHLIQVAVDGSIKVLYLHFLCLSFLINDNLRLHLSYAGH